MATDENTTSTTSESLQFTTKMVEAEFDRLVAIGWDPDEPYTYSTAADMVATPWCWGL